MTDKLIIIGESPPRKGAQPMDGMTGDRLANLMGLSSRKELLETVSVAVNLGTVSPQQDFKRWENRARRVWCKIRATLKPGDVVIILGAEARRMMRRCAPWYHGRDELGACHFGDVDFVFIPHTSGRNRWWSSPKNMGRARDLVRNYTSRFVPVGVVRRGDVASLPALRDWLLTHGIHHLEEALCDHQDS